MVSSVLSNHRLRHSSTSQRIRMSKMNEKEILELEETDTPPSVFSRIRGFLVAALYGICSAGMAFANKGLLNSQDFNYPAFLMCCQMIVTFITFEILRRSSILKFEGYSLSRGKSFILPSVFYSLNAILALSALSGMNIPMYGAIKRCNPLVILLLGMLILKKGPPSIALTGTVILITSGCVLAGYGDLGFDLKAYIFGGASVIIQSVYLILVQKSAADFGPLETVHINSVNTLPIFLITALSIGELPSAITSFKATDPVFITMFILVVMMGCLLNLLLFMCTQVNSALTTSIVGSLKSIAQTAIGIFLFEGLSLNRFTVTGITMNLVGGILYTLVKFRESAAKKVADNPNMKPGS